MNLVPVDATMPKHDLTRRRADDSRDGSGGLQISPKRCRRWFPKAARRTRIMPSEWLLAMVRQRRCGAVVGACVVADALVRACVPATCEPVLADLRARTCPWKGKHLLLNRDRGCALYWRPE